MKNDNLGRKIYAEKIAEEIVEHYDLEKSKLLAGKKKERENIVFAVSGKWGEGKTDLLNRLEPILEKKGFKVIWFNPWQYSQEDISLKRAFLKAVQRKINPEFDLSDLYYDRTRTIIDWKNIKWFNYFKLILSWVFTIGFLLPLIFDYSLTLWWQSIFSFLNLVWGSGIAAVVLTVFLMPLLIQAITISSRSAQVKTAEEFEDKFNELLKGKEKIVIFIDDLDRCTPDTVKVVLDSLRTFFCHSKCAYVITGDHTVIERYAGEEIDKKREFTQLKRLQEGRRFLKKIFDVYWRLPLATPRQFGDFVNDEIKILKLSFSETSQSSSLKSFLTDDSLFERNPRHVKRFITKLRFAIKGVDLQKKELEQRQNDDQKDSKDALEDILANPNLLAKVLLIEEFFYPIYEELILHPEEFVNHEKLLRGGKSPSELKVKEKNVSKLLDDKEQDLERLERYALLVKKVPQFTDQNNTTLHEVASYFLFSGSTGLPSIFGPDDSNFEQDLKAGQFADKIGPQLEVSKKEKKENFANKALEIFDQGNDQEKVNIVSDSLKLASRIDEWASKLSQWKQKLFSLPEDKQNALSKEFWVAVLQKSPTLLTEVKKEKPAYMELLWPVLESIDEKVIHKDAKVNLENLLKEFIEPSSLNLKGVKIYLDRFGSKNLEEEIRTKLVDPTTCRTYFEYLQKINDSESKIAKIVLEKLKSFIENFDHIDWTVSNRDFLKSVSLFDNVKTKTVLWSKDPKQLIKVASLRDVLELADKEKNGIKNQVLELTRKSADLQFFEDGNVQAILDKESKVKIFGKLKEILENVNESLEKRKKSASLLNKSSSIWNSLELNNIYEFLKDIKKLKIGKIADLKDKPKEILDSWGYNETDKEDEKK